MNVDDLRRQIEQASVDTVLLCFADMQGRLMGKRLTGRHFLDSVLDGEEHGCAYVLAVDVDMNTVSGYSHASWESGYGDFVMAPDLDTLRPVPWLEGTALLMADLVWHDHTPVEASPRAILRGQVDRLVERGWTATAATELEFQIFNDTYEQAWRSHYLGLDPANLYNVDYSILGTTKVEPLVRRIRNAMAGAGMFVETAKGECNFGQHEVNFRHSDALSTADDHTIYKNGAKEIAHLEGKALTFMAKFDENEGNSCHIHLSVRGADGAPIMADDEQLFGSFLAGILACMREFTLLYAPNINSYKRFVEASFAPTAVAWGRDNRTCSMRVVGEGPSLRVENRLPGGDVNPYLALAGMIAAGLHGVDNQLELEPEIEGSAYEADLPRVPGTLREARELWCASEVAREVFGQQVVDHYANMADVEIQAFDRAVTDWERFRGFERL